jgi:hypothetical protein
MALGIEKLKVAAKLLISFGQKIESTSKDGFQIVELFSFLGELSQIPAIFADKDEIVAEFKDLDATERAELVAYIETELTLENKKVEAIIEKSLGVLISILQLVDSLKTAPAEPTV